MKLLRIFPAFLLLIPALSFADDDKFRMYQHSTSMNVITDHSYARECFDAANIAARIHYTNREEIENCTMALNFGQMSAADRAATFTNRGIIYMALQDYEKAISDYSMALSIKPEHGEIYVNIGNVYYLGKVYDKAIEEYTKAIDMQTTRLHVAHTNRAMAYENLDDFENAEQDYRAAMEIVPDSDFLQTRLNQLLDKKSNL